MCVFIFDGVGENVIEWSPLVRNCLDVCELKKTKCLQCEMSASWRENENTN